MESPAALWGRLAPRYAELAVGQPDKAWLSAWSDLSREVEDVFARAQVATTVDTNDAEAKAHMNAFLDDVYEPWSQAEHALKERLLASGYTEEGIEVPMKKMAADASVFLEANLPLQSAEQKLGNTYDELIGAQTVEWEGKEVTLSQLGPVLAGADRDKREAAWRLAMDRRAQDRDRMNALWVEFLDNRLQQAANLGKDYRSVVWARFRRFDYTPEDCRRFADAIEQEVVPAATRVLERRKQRLGLSSLRPWDLDATPANERPLEPFRDVEEFSDKAKTIFDQVDPVLGGYYQDMQEHKLLDLGNRKGKAPGGYCTAFAVARRPFIFMNAVGIHDDVQTLLHEGGHAFHVYETAALPYRFQEDVNIEFCEVASMAMELLSAPYLVSSKGGYYSPEDAARARVQHLEKLLLFWPYMAVVDQFQNWVYENPGDAREVAKCDAQWLKLWRRFMPGVDWSGFEEEEATGWHRKLHIYQIPFYYVEYGLAQLGAVQVFANARKHQAQAVADYRHALALGGTRSLPELFAAAGARFAFDAPALRSAVATIEETMAELC